MTKKSNKKPHKMARSVVDKMAKNLATRLHDLALEAEAFMTMIGPNPQHSVIEHQTRTACLIMVERLAYKIREAETLSNMIANPEHTA